MSLPHAAGCTVQYTASVLYLYSRSRIYTAAAISAYSYTVRVYNICKNRVLLQPACRAAVILLLTLILDSSCRRSTAAQYVQSSRNRQVQLLHVSAQQLYGKRDVKLFRTWDNTHNRCRRSTAAQHVQSSSNRHVQLTICVQLLY